MNKDFLLGLEPRLADALEEFVFLFNMDAMRWAARLWDPISGGFYYSNSARDHEGFGADLESTAQILRVIDDRGMIDSYGSMKKAMPEDIADKLVAFADERLDEDGYFYHPQWGKNIGTSRRGRDLQWGRIIYKMFDKTPPRKTAVELLQGADRPTITTLPEHLKSKKAFREYLEAEYAAKASYPLGHGINAQMVQIEAAGLLEECCKFLDAKQNPGNGLWEEDITYRSVSGLMKLSVIYIRANRRMNFPEKISDSIFTLLKSRDAVDQIVYIYNPLSALSQQIYTLNLVNENYEAARLVSRLKDDAYDVVRIMTDKTRCFAKPDGSFSYSPEFSACRSQNVPSALKNTCEGDVNATTIASGGIVSNLLTTLGFSAKTFDKEDFDEFISIVRAQKPAIKAPVPEGRMP